LRDIQNAQPGQVLLYGFSHLISIARGQSRAAGLSFPAHITIGGPRPSTAQVVQPAHGAV
jgi:hypothetical protein